MTLLLDASGEKTGMAGRVWFKERTGSKTITKVHFRFGPVTKTGGSTLQVSLQDVSTVNVKEPDGTVDQSYTIANADAAFTANGWYTATLGAGRSVQYGEDLAVVFEWGTFGAGDSVVISSIQGANASIALHPWTKLYTGGAWGTEQSRRPNILFEFSDGSFGCFDGSDAVPVAKSLSGLSFNSGSSPDEYALEFQLPIPVKIDALWFVGSMSGIDADAELILYDGAGTALVTVTLDATKFHTAGNSRNGTYPIAEMQLQANTTYRLALRPTTANNVALNLIEVNNAAHFAVFFADGSTWKLASRTNQGSWTTTATMMILAGVRISALDNGASAVSTRGRVIRK